MKLIYPELKEWDFKVHDTRRLFARQIQEKLGKKAVQDVLKHSKMSTTELYLSGEQKTHGAFDDV